MTGFNTIMALFGIAAGTFALTVGMMVGDPIAAALGAFLVGWVSAGVLFLLGRGPNGPV